VQKVVHPPDELVCDVHPTRGRADVRLGGALAGAAANLSFLDSSDVHVPGTAQRSAERAPDGDA
jgi:hypothetical protein